MQVFITATEAAEKQSPKCMGVKAGESKTGVCVDVTIPGCPLSQCHVFR